MIAILSGVFVIKCKNPVHSALALVNTFVCLAVFYVMLYAPFMAAIQIMVYAGAIMVLIIFVIMLLNLGTQVTTPVRRSLLWGSISGAIMLLTVGTIASRSYVPSGLGDMTTRQVMDIGHTELIGKALFTQFLLPFEIASILLLVAIIGAVVLAKREV